MRNKKKTNKKITPKDHRVLTFLAIATMLPFSLLLIQFFKLQIIDGPIWSQKALMQHQTIIKEPFRRGRFLSNTSISPGNKERIQPLVVDVPKYHLYVDPDSIDPDKKEPILEFLYKQFPLNEEQKERMKGDFYRKSRSRKLFSYLDREKKQEIEAWFFTFAKKNKVPKNGIYFTRDFQRSYPFGSLMGAILHTTQEQKDPITHQSIPTGGLELYFDTLLQGKMGKKSILRSLTHALDTGKVIQKPEHGADIYLTINHYLQSIAEIELEKGVKNVGGKGGWAIMMDPYTGEILALAQYPGFDPRNYPDYFNDPAKIEHTRVKAAMDSFEPGSIFKPITMAICLRANEELIAQGKDPIFIPEEKFPTKDGRFPGRKTPIKDGREHNYLNMYLAIQKSSNIYMGRVLEKAIEQLGENWYRNALIDLFGFGSPTGIELPSEIVGQIPRPGKKHPNGTLEWSASTLPSLATGHNILVSSLQMVKAFSIIANGGYDVQPTLIRKVVKNEEVIQDNTPRFSREGRRKILSEESVKKLVKAMKFTTKKGGTSPSGDIMGYSEAGKSGTSEKIIDGKYSQDRYVSSFVGFAPAENPRFVLMVTVDEPVKKFVPGVGKLYHGGVCAPPIFREIGKRALQYLGVTPDDPYGYPPGDPRRDVTKADWFQEVDELLDTYQKWNSK